MKISYAQYREILALKREHFIQKFLSYDLFVGDGACTIRARIPMLTYILIFIPMHLFAAVLLMWDGGLKEFEIQPRTINHWVFQNDTKPYERAKEIYKGA